MRPFYPSNDDIALRIVERVIVLSDEEVTELLDRVLGEFEDRHEGVEQFYRNRFEQVRHYLGEEWEPSPERQALIGAHFTHEYSPESAALFNPSIVPHPDQTGLPRGTLRFILSLRATGEGHISSISFRTGTISARHRITLTPPVPFVKEPERVPNPVYDKELFARKLQEVGLRNDFCQRVLDRLPEAFVLDALHQVLTVERRQTDPVVKRFGTFVALDGVSARVNRGEVVCLIGPSGSASRHCCAARTRSRSSTAGASCSTA